MTPERLRAVEAEITAKRIRMSLEDAHDYARRALVFKSERGRLPSLTSSDVYERKMAEGIEVLKREALKAQRAAA